MKKGILLLCGLLIAGAAAFALPEDHSPPLKQLINIEMNHFDAVVAADVQLDNHVDAAIVFDETKDVEIFDKEIEAEFVVMDEGELRRGHWYVFKPGNLNLANTPKKGLIDKNWCRHRMLRYQGINDFDTGFSGSMRLIDKPHRY